MRTSPDFSILLVNRIAAGVLNIVIWSPAVCCSHASLIVIPYPYHHSIDIPRLTTKTSAGLRE